MYLDVKLFILRVFFVAQTMALAPLAHADSASYQAAPSPDNIASTFSPEKFVPVNQPRTTQGHPCTFWDTQDIAHYKEMLQTSKELQIQFNQLKADMDARIAQGVNLPAPQKVANGGWAYPGTFMPPTTDPIESKFDGTGRFRRMVFRDGQAIGSLGTLYALTGDEKYANFAKQLLLAYAADLPDYGPPPTYNLRFGQGILTQLLDEGQLLTNFAHGYDMIYNLPSWTAGERKQIHDGLMWSFVGELMYPANPERNMTDTSYATQVNNRGLLTATGVLCAGYATDDPEWINAALYGVKSTLPKADKARYTTFPPLHDWTAGTKDAPFGGIIDTHLTKCITDDGMWIEGSPGYALYAGNGIIFSAQILWHHGVNLSPHQYDLSYHIRGKVSSDLAFNATPFTAPPVGYNTLTHVQMADAADKPWALTLTRDTYAARVLSAGGSATRVITGDGGVYQDDTSNAPHAHAPATTVIERRVNAANTVYGNVIDLSNARDGYVKSVTQEGGPDAGYALLRVQTSDGTDLCLTSYRPSKYSPQGIATDAQQAYVRASGQNITAFYLGGGTSLQAGDGSITRSAPGLAYIEKRANGDYVVANPSGSAATVTVTLSGISSLKAFTLDAKNQKGAPAQVTPGPSAGSLSLPIPAQTRIILTSST